MSWMDTDDELILAARTIEAEGFDGSAVYAAKAEIDRLRGLMFAQSICEGCRWSADRASCDVCQWRTDTGCAIDGWEPGE